MTTKFYARVVVACFAIFILSAIVSGFLESSGTFDVHSIDPKIRTAMKVFYFSVFLAIGFSFVPLMLKLFIFAQVKIGNGEFFAVKFLRQHERKVVCCVWGMFVLGLILSLPSAIKEGFFK